MKSALIISQNPMTLKETLDYVFSRGSFLDNRSIEISSESQTKIREAQKHLYALMEKKVPIYGVTTGFGDSCFRVVPNEMAEQLQSNLISYLACGTGPNLPEAASRAALLIRLKSLSRGYSGVSLELIERMKLFLENNWSPVIPREGSLGASGDLIPLSYIAQAIQGVGPVQVEGQLFDSKELHLKKKITPYKLKPKEGLSIVNGTSAMAGLCLLNLNHAKYLTELATLSSAWACIALQGKLEAFGVLVNEKAKTHPGQKLAAQNIRTLLKAEKYQSIRGQDVTVANGQTIGFVQDRYSLRCSPQILGPVLETLELAWGWLEQEINSSTDNPLIDEDGSLGMGGNFYGGYLGHAMDYLKVCTAQIADLLDRQLTMLIDEKANRGLPPNLADWDSIPENERFLHHGLKGLHQAVNAITSEIMASSMPNTVFSRSSESHNQDKVSLGMSSAVACSEMIEKLFTIQAMYLICLAQALDLRKFVLQGQTSRQIYELIRKVVPKVTRDTSLGDQIKALSEKLKEQSNKHGRIFENSEP